MVVLLQTLVKLGLWEQETLSRRLPLPEHETLLCVILMIMVMTNNVGSLCGKLLLFLKVEHCGARTSAARYKGYKRSETV